MKIEAIKAAKRRRGNREIEHEQQPARFENSLHFGDCAAPIFHIPQSESHGESVKTHVFEWQRERIREHKVREAFSRCFIEHRLAEIGSRYDGIRACLLKCKSKVTTPGCDIQYS